MIEYYLLQEMTVFARTGTLAKTAKEMGLTQPSITHSMKKLEDQLQVRLFVRRPNKIYLTETGKFTARQAKLLLDANADFIKKVHRYEQNQQTITIAANAPGPLIVVRALHDSQIRIQSQLVQQNGTRLLAEGQITCLLSNQNLRLADIESVYLGTERMSVNLPPQSPLARRKKISFRGLAGKTIISPGQIGFWQRIYEKSIPGGKFIYQNKSLDYSAILNYSSLIYTTTNLTAIDHNWGKDLPGDRLTVPLDDKIAQQKFYISFRTQNKKRLQPLIRELQETWAKCD